MKKSLFSIVLFFVLSLTAFGQMDTLRVSHSFTTHIICSTDLVYADVSNKGFIKSGFVEQNKNIFALMARQPFVGAASVSLLESSGQMKTFIVVYESNPKELIVDIRPKIEEPSGETAFEQVSAPKGRGKLSARSKVEKDVVSKWKTGRAPTLREVSDMERELYHLGVADYDMEVYCENIFFHSDITYVVLSLKNNSGISYDVGDASFVVESKKQSKRTVSYDKPVFPSSKHGSLFAAPGESSKIVYAFEKLTLSKDQVLKIYLYETKGQRNLSMKLGYKDINKAVML